MIWARDGVQIRVSSCWVTWIQRNLPLCRPNPATVHEARADWKWKNKPESPHLTTSPSFCHTCKSVRCSLTRRRTTHMPTTQKHVQPSTSFSDSPEKLCRCNQINSGANLLPLSVPGCSQPSTDPSLIESRLTHQSSCWSLLRTQSRVVVRII